MKRLITSYKVDESQVEYSVNNVQMRDIKNNPYDATTISLIYNGEYVGDLIFSVYEESNLLYIENIEVQDSYRGIGLAQLLYKKFGDIYREQYDGWIVEREFQNPTAESAFKSAIDLGWVPQEAFNEDHTNRTY